MEQQQQQNDLRITIPTGRIKAMFGSLVRGVRDLPVHAPRIVNTTVTGGGALITGTAGGLAETLSSLCRTVKESSKRGWNQPMRAVRLVARDSNGHEVSLFDNTEPSGVKVNKIALNAVDETMSMVEQARRVCKANGKMGTQLALIACENNLASVKEMVKSGKDVDIGAVCAMALETLSPYLDQIEVSAAAKSLNMYEHHTEAKSEE